MSEAPTYPAELAIEPLTGPVDATVRVPGSKSITNRALVLAALADGPMPCSLTGCLRSEDTEIMVAALQALRFTVRPEWDAQTPTIHIGGTELNGRILAKTADIFVGNSGTSIRFLTAILGLGHGRYRLDGVPRMRQRPIGDLLGALEQLGVHAYAEYGNGCPPVIVEATGLRGGNVRVRGDVSSQFLSGLLMAAPFAYEGMTISIEGNLVSEPYVDMTVEMLRQWHCPVEVLPGPTYRVSYGFSPPDIYPIEPDASAASYFWAAAAIAGGRVTVPGLTAHSIQGDVAFVNVLDDMGCTVVRSSEGITAHGGPLRGIDVDMNAISDTVMTLAAVACFAEGPTTIRNVAHIRHKETDRIAAVATELRRLGADVDERPDGLTITPRPLRGTAVETYNDHRMAMSLALIGLRVPGVVIRNPACVAKTYPRFFDDLLTLRAGRTAPTPGRPDES
jgi:3-phosphoshikimate 1-carboxyvinyltransferase